MAESFRFSIFDLAPARLPDQSGPSDPTDPSYGKPMNSILDNLRLYFRLLGVSLRGQMQYRASFLMLAAGQFLITGMEFVGIWALFDRFGSLRGWSLP